MNKILCSLAFLSGFITHTHSSLDNQPYSPRKFIPWYGSTHKKDLAIAATMSAAFFGGSFLVKENSPRTIIQTAALLVPLVRFLSTTGIIKNTVNAIPGLKSVMGCASCKCEGICDECVMRHTLMEVGIVATFLSLNTSISEWVNKKKKDQEVVNLNKECPVCMRSKKELKEEGDVSWRLMPCCQNKNWICNECISELFKFSDLDTINCPLCKKEVDPYNQTINNFKTVKKESANEKEGILQNPYLSPFFNATFLRSGSIISSFAGLVAYADHRHAVKDGAITVACCGGLLALASRINDPIKQQQLLLSALMIPFIGLLNKSEKIRRIANAIPFLNHAFGCEKKGCHSICAHCKLRNAHRTTIAVIGASLIGAAIFGRS